MRNGWAYSVGHDLATVGAQVAAEQADTDRLRTELADHAEHGRLCVEVAIAQTGLATTRAARQNRKR